ncbi:hypothetical protein MMC10_001314 [Thelotrema lepadinum]|nr:hypothetical protein [Thelotrema lepadinum]
MRAFAVALTVVAALLGRSIAIPVQIVHPGDANDIVITDQDTLNATQVTNSTQAAHSPQSAQTSSLPLSFVNNFPGNVNAYVTGLDVNGNLVMLQPNGQWYYPPSTTASTPQPITADVGLQIGGQGATLKIALPDYISAARLWFANGDLQFFVVSGANGKPSLVEPSSSNPDDPNADINWGFVELSWVSNGGLFANISYVDFVGMVLSMSLVTGSKTTVSAGGLASSAVNSICSKLAAQGAEDGQPWGDLCMADSSGTLLRVIAPGDYMSTNPSAFKGYYDSYIDQVWAKYASSPLTINTQAAAGNVSCTVSGSTLTCDGDNRGYAKPSAADIFGCNSGPFAIEAGDNAVHYAVVPRLCAAFVRTTLLLPGGNVQPSLPASSYYSTSPTDWFSAFVHENEIDNLGYAFSYDDVNPSGENESGVVSDANPQLLTITIGG